MSAWQRPPDRAGRYDRRTWRNLRKTLISFGRGDEADDLVFLQLLDDVGEFALRQPGHRDAHLVESAGHRAGRDLELVGFEKLGDVVGTGLRRKPDEREGADARIGRWRGCGFEAACVIILDHDAGDQSGL